MEDRASANCSQAALLITHPGHELLVHGWLTIERPIVLVLTNGAGPDRHAIRATAQVVREAGASPGTIFGRMTDTAIERALIDRNHSLFHALTTDLAAELVRRRVTCVVGDSAEGECLAHDVWRGMINAAVAIAANYLDRPPLNLTFPLFRTADAVAPPQPHVYQRRLDAAQHSAKLRASHHYESPPEEFHRRQSAGQIEGLRDESLRVVSDDDAGALGESPRPAYERQGELRVAAGKAQRVIRFRDHVLPLLSSLRHLRDAA